MVTLSKFYYRMQSSLSQKCPERERGAPYVTDTQSGGKGHNFISSEWLGWILNTADQPDRGPKADRRLEYIKGNFSASQEERGGDTTMELVWASRLDLEKESVCFRKVSLSIVKSASLMEGKKERNCCTMHEAEKSEQAGFLHEEKNITRPK